jgi:hypothetical protein
MSLIGGELKGTTNALIDSCHGADGSCAAALGV